MIYSSVLEAIGHTPIIRLNHLPEKGADVFVKFEGMNPSGSVKDRLALAIILEAEASGRLTPGQTVVEATSGNTGIGLAMICAARGYPFVAVMTETYSVERRKLMRSLGAKVVLTPAAEAGTGMVRVAKELSERHGWFLADQFRNPANPSFHKKTTAAEILQDFAGRHLDAFVGVYGTGGTLSGCGAMLKAAWPECKIIAVEPEQAQLLKKEAWHGHKIQGVTPDFIAETFDTSIVDAQLAVSDEQARDCALQLSQREGIMSGVSGGAAVCAALRYAATLPEGKTVLTLIPDNSSRYISGYLFDGISEGGDDIK